VRIVVTAPAAENARSSVWMHLVDGLRDEDHDVFAFDPLTASVASKDKDPLRQARWVCESFEPELVVILGNDEVWDQLASEFSFEIKRFSAPAFNLVCNATELALGVNRRLFKQVGEPNLDSIFVGTHDDARASLLKSLVGRLNLEVHGYGWNHELGLDRVSHRPPYAVELALVLSRANSVICLPETSVPGTSVELQALQAAAAGRTALVPLAEKSDVTEKVGAGYFSDAGELYELAKSYSPKAQQIIEIDWAQITSRAHVQVHERVPKVSVIMSSYNVAEYIPFAIRSILDQTEQDFEIIACNDGSPDNSKEVIEKYASSDSRVRLVDQPNIGQTGRFDYIWNRLGRLAKADLIAFLGADDIARKDRLERQLQCFDEDPLLDICHTAGELIDNNNVVTSRGAFSLVESYRADNFARVIQTYNHVAAPTLMVRRDIYDRTGPWECGFSSDYHYWMKSASTLRYRYIPMYLTRWRNHEKSSSTGYDVEHTYAEGTRIRRLELDSQSIEDLYPNLEHSTSDRDFAAAYVDLAQRVVGRIPEPEIALAYLDAARNYVDTPERPIEITAALALKKLGEQERAQRLLNEVAAGISYEALGDESLPAAKGISTFPFEIPNDDKYTWAWDGVDPAIKRILVVPNVANVEPNAAVLRAFADSFAIGDRVQLSFPILNVDQDTLLQLLAAAAVGIDMEKVPDVTIDFIEDISLVPRDRFSSMFDLRPGAAMQDIYNACVAEFQNLT
jgi:glycosyltransferase involved in cell wall biosynthesis